jgi:hypothetical protein
MYNQFRCFKNKLMGRIEMKGDMDSGPFVFCNLIIGVLWLVIIIVFEFFKKLFGNKSRA